MSRQTPRVNTPCAPFLCANSEFPLAKDVANREEKNREESKQIRAMMSHFQLYADPTATSNAPPLQPSDISIEKVFQAPQGQVLRMNNIIDAKHIIRTSEVVHGFGRCANLAEIISIEKQQHRNTLATSHNSLFRQFIPANNNQLQGQRTGFRQAALLYFSQLKTYQPYLYELCFRIASACFSALANTPHNDAQPASAISTVSAWQDETRLVSGLLTEYQKQQVRHPAQFPLFVFINGNDPDKLAARTAEVQAYLTQQSPQNSLPIYAFSAQLNGWRMGLKCLPVIVGLMHRLLITSRLPANKRDDSDIAVNVFDADILAIRDHQNLQRKADNITAGMLNNHGSYHDDENLLAEQNSHYLLIAKLHKSIFKHLINRALIQKQSLQKQSLTLTDIASLPLKLHACGANASWSALVYLLLGGMKAFSHNEVLDFVRLLSRSCEQAFDCHSPLQAQHQNLAWFPSSTTKSAAPEQNKEPTQDKAENSVLCDGGAVSRSVQSGVPIIEQFNVLAHDRTHLYQLTPMDNNPDNPSNIRRIQQEIGFILAKYLGINDWIVKQHVNHTDQTPWQETTLTTLLAQQLSQLAHSFNTLLQPISANVTLQLIAPGSDLSVRKHKKNNVDTHPNLAVIPAIHMTFNHPGHTSEQQIDLAEYQQRYQLNFVNL